jgi:hypothetical protein
VTVTVTRAKGYGRCLKDTYFSPPLIIYIIYIINYNNATRPLLDHHHHHHQADSSHLHCSFYSALALTDDDFA